MEEVFLAVIHMLSIIIPCHNEENNVALIMERFLELRQSETFELIAVNNASKDKTGEVLKDYQTRPGYSFLRVVDEPTPGYGYAIMAGLRAASGEMLAWTHADLQTDPSDVLRAFQLLQQLQATDRKQSFAQHRKFIVKGRRIKRGGIDGVFTFGMGVLASIVLRMPLWDVNAQPKVFDRRLFSLMTNPPGDFSLDVYWLWLAKKNGYTTSTIPVDFGKRLHGESKSAPNLQGKVKTSWKTIQYIFLLARTK